MLCVSACAAAVISVLMIINVVFKCVVAGLRQFHPQQPRQLRDDCVLIVVDRCEPALPWTSSHCLLVLCVLGVFMGGVVVVGC